MSRRSVLGARRGAAALVAVTAATIASGATGQQLELTTTYAGGNGLDGSMFDVTAVHTVTIASFDVHFGSPSAALPFLVPFEVYAIAGGYQGHQNDAAAWTRIGAGQLAVATPLGTPQPLPLAIDVTIPAGQTVGFYVTNTGGAAQNIAYTNGTGAVFADANIRIAEGLGCAYPFGASFSPRTWNGTVHYTLGAPCPATTYCTAKPSSGGCVPTLSYAGSPSASLTDGFTITASGVPSGVFGTFVYSLQGRAAIPLFGGTLCVQPPLRRTRYAIAASGGSAACDGELSIDFNAYRAHRAHPALVAGRQVNGQFFHRDPGFAAPDNIGLSDAIEFTICF